MRETSNIWKCKKCGGELISIFCWNCKKRTECHCYNCKAFVKKQKKLGKEARVIQKPPSKFQRWGDCPWCRNCYFIFEQS